MDGGRLTLLYLHLLATVVYLGGLVTVGGILLPVMGKVSDRRQGREMVIRVIRIFHPVSLLCLGVLVITGASSLTGFKVRWGLRYFVDLYSILGPKLLLVFVLILVSTYQFFGVGLRLSRMWEGEGEGRPADPMRVGRLFRHLTICVWVNVLLTVAVVYLGLVLSRA